MTVDAITLDCADPLALAAFYRQATGYALHERSCAEFAGVTRPDGFFIGFQRVDDYRAPSWPGQDVPQQLHACFRTDDLEGMTARLLELGAGRPEFQPGDASGGFVVLTDPAGHPFCVMGPR
ncbi:VOC family protein [Streptomyces sp. SID8379]|nr:VOC family protein [Streptomyces sp. SID8379]